MKHYLHNSLRALFLSLAVLLSLPMLAVYEVEIDGIKYDLNSETKQATVIKGYRYSGSIVIPESVEYWVTAYSVTSIRWSAFANCSGLTSVTIPNSVTSIGEDAFLDCSGLTSVTIPNSVTSIGNRAFNGCSGLTSIVVEDGNPVYDSRNNCNAIIETATNTLHFGCKTTIIPNSVTSIGSYAFYKCSGLTSVTIPNSVTSIGDHAFYDCSGLTSVTIGNSVTSIGSYAFWGCSGLTSVTIGNSVESIGVYAFSSCSELLDVYCYAENVPSTGSGAFDHSYQEYVTLHVPAASIDSYKATWPWNSFGKIVALTPEETGIDELKDENGKVKSAVYDLSGRRVQKAQKGVYVQNGKVVMVR